MKTINILYIEDSKEDYELIEQLLLHEGLNHKMTRIETRAEFQFAIENSEFNVILADCTLPTFGGIEALQIAQEKIPDVPFIFVSGTIGEETAIKYLRAGATDYVLKHRLTRLIPAICRAVAEMEEKRKRKQAEESLKHSQRMEAIGKLAAGASHDFSNILSLIDGLAQSLIENQQFEQVLNTAQAIQEVAHRGIVLVEHLLTFARENHGRFTIINFNEYINRTTNLLRESLPKNILLETHLSGNIPSILGDAQQIERIVRNLIANARDSMPTGGTLTINTHLVDADKIIKVEQPDSAREHYLCCQIKDTGVGMDQDVLQHIFEPFFSTKVVGKGDGLGLSVVYGLMQSHHGFIDVESKEGHGTTISLYFPTCENIATIARNWISLSSGTIF
jgi:signal transduction histidine kinase